MEIRTHLWDWCATIQSFLLTFCAFMQVEKVYMGSWTPYMSTGLIYCKTKNFQYASITTFHLNLQLVLETRLTIEYLTRNPARLVLETLIHGMQNKMRARLTNRHYGPRAPLLQGPPTCSKGPCIQRKSFCVDKKCLDWWRAKKDHQIFIRR
jgi:hypothetical protein